MKISVVVPVFNECEGVSQLHEEITQSLRSFLVEGEFEIIYVDDGSTDNTSNALSTLTPATVITLRRNQGQTAAMKAGIDHAKGDFITLLDGDGQNDPSNIKTLFNYLLDNNLDLVCGWRENRKDSKMKKFVSKGAYLIRQILISDKIHDSGCTQKIGRRDILQSMPLYGEFHRLIPALVALDGYLVGEVPVVHRERKFGTSKYTWHRIIKGIIDIGMLWFWKKFESRPMHFFGGLGLLAIFAGLGAAMTATILYIFDSVFFRNSLPVLAAVLIMAGIQLISVGMLGDRIFRIHYDQNNRTRYLIKSIKNKP